ncbi:MAG: hypothetical protein IT186_18095 [Acidobacteria bacterium]|nr:hypothetical protein [Acidobacteriota bacterium]MCG3191743.1 hypothetical protein [Thermoanaerobaculia bacterium]MCK6682373.1 hypothetical protein [Thermoanaerobaculia bacterium]
MQIQRPQPHDFPYPSPFLRRPALALTFMLFAITVLFAARFAKEMLTSSLWNDELYSILNYSGRGPITTLTEYIPNNHILYNLLNSIGPDPTSFSPARVRAMATAAIAVLGLLLLVHFGVKRQLPVGVLSLQPLIGNYEFLDLSLQGRGYGVAALLAAAAGLLLISLHRTPTTGRLVFFASLNVLGILALPTFAFWSIPLFIILFLRHRHSHIVIAALGAAAATILLHIGVLPRILDNAMGGYGEEWGRQFSRITAVYESLRIYFVGSPERASDALLTWLGLLLVLLVAYVVRTTPDAPELSLLLSVFVAFGICLTLETPLVRTTSFLAPPLSISVWSAVARFIDTRPSVAPKGREFILYGLLLLFLVRDTRKLFIFHFVPIESWKTTAELVSSVFPENVSVGATVAPDFLSGYLPSRKVRLWEPKSSGLPEDCRTVVADTAMMPTDNRIRLSTEEKRSTAAVFVPQRRERHQIVYFRPCTESIAEVSASGIGSPSAVRDLDFQSCGTIGAGGAAIRVTFGGDVRVRSILVSVARPATDIPRFEARVGTGSAFDEPCAAPVVSLVDGIVIITTKDCRLKSADITFSPEWSGAKVCEAWAYPSRFPVHR